LQANVLLSLGCIPDALRLFEQLQAWTDVIKCYLAIGQGEKAEKLVRKKLEEKEEPEYYCLLGDITNNGEYFEKAIEVCD
jgi:tetratricopeptide (TPR) repeat protein